MKKVSHVFEFLFMVGFSAFLNLVPFSFLDRLSRGLVFIFFPLAGRAVERIRNNLKVTYPDMTEEEIIAFAKANIAFSLRVSLEIMQARKFKKEKFIRKYVRPISEDIEFYYKRRYPNEGTICLQGHLGSWEIPIPYFAHTGNNVTAVVKKQSNPYATWLLDRRRRNYGANVLYVEEASAILRSITKRKDIMGMAADQDAGGGNWVDFMGRKASTFEGPAVMAYLAEADITLLTCLFQGKGVYRVDIKPVITGHKRSDYASKDEAVAQISQAWASALEVEVRKHPEQYFWLHRRWKSQPAEKS